MIALPEATIMFELHKNYILDENQQPIAVQIPITEFEQIEDLENYGLVKLIESTEDDERLSKDSALKYYQSLKGQHVDKLSTPSVFSKNLPPYQ